MGSLNEKAQLISDTLDTLQIESNSITEEINSLILAAEETGENPPKFEEELQRLTRKRSEVLDKAATLRVEYYDLTGYMWRD